MIFWFSWRRKFTTIFAGFELRNYVSLDCSNRRLPTQPCAAFGIAAWSESVWIHI
jgi:hypothetical protein